MTLWIRMIGLALLLVCAVSGQTAAWPQFESASVRRASPQGEVLRSTMSGGPGTADPGRIVYVGVSFKGLLTKAFGVKGYQVLAPSWMESERYDITATLPADTSGEQFALMLQKLLEDRFLLKVHHETQNSPVYRLLADKAEPALRTSETTTPSMIGMAMTPAGDREITATGTTIAALAEMLAGIESRPVLDGTGLRDRYDFKLIFSPGVGAESTATGPSLFTAVREQLGLTLTPQKAPVEMLIVESAGKIPTEN